MAAFVHRARCAGHAVYIHCHAGISRSSTACAVYLMTHLDLSLRDAMAHLLRCRETVCPNPGFREQLERFEASSGQQNESDPSGASSSLVALSIGVELDSDDDQPVTSARICIPPPSAADVRASLRAATATRLWALT